MTSSLLPPGYTEKVFLLFDFTNTQQIAVNDLRNVLSCLGYNPDAILSTAVALMCDDVQLGTRATPRAAPQANGSFAAGLSGSFVGVGSNSSFSNASFSKVTVSSKSETITLARFLDGMSKIEALRGGWDDVPSTVFRLFDVQKKGIVGVEDMLVAGCLQANTLTEKECKLVVQGLKSNERMKGLTLGDFKQHLR